MIIYGCQGGTIERNLTLGWNLKGMIVEGSTACAASSMIKTSKWIGCCAERWEDSGNIAVDVFMTHSRSIGDPDPERVQQTISASSMRREVRREEGERKANQESAV